MSRGAAAIFGRMWRAEDRPVARQTVGLAADRLAFVALAAATL